MNELEKNKLKSKIIGIASIVGVGLILTLLSNFVFKYSGIDDNIKEEVKQPLSPYQEKDLINKVIIENNFKNSSNDGKPDGSFYKYISVIGSIDHGYLYIKSNVNGKPLSIYDKVYVKIQNNHTVKQIGGWLVLDKSLNTSNPKSEQSTKLLFDLSNVQYEQTGQNGFETTSGDWLKMLNQNQNDTKSVVGFSSTMRNGEIEEISISYSCSTNSNCSISVNDK